MRIVSFLTAAMLAVSLSACSTGDNSEPTAQPTVTVTAEPEKPAPYSDEEYASLLRSEATELRTVPTDILIETSEAVCDGLDSGLTIEQIIFTASGADLLPETVGVIVGGAVAHVCPEYGYVFDQGYTS